MIEQECKNCKKYHGDCGNHHIDSFTGHIDYEIPAEKMYTNRFDPCCFEPSEEYLNELQYQAAEYIASHYSFEVIKKSLEIAEAIKTP